MTGGGRYKGTPDDYVIELKDGEYVGVADPDGGTAATFKPNKTPPWKDMLDAVMTEDIKVMTWEEVNSAILANGGNGVPLLNQPRRDGVLTGGKSSYSTTTSGGTWRVSFPP